MYNLRRVTILLVLAALALTAAGQEPRPAEILSDYLSDPDGVGLERAWRYAPGEVPGAADPGFDDRTWTPVRPSLPEEDLARSGGWGGSGWFRRHLQIDPALFGRQIGLRFSAPGTAKVYLDGRLLLDTSTPGAAPQIPGDRRQSVLVVFDRRIHLLAVHYVYPSASEKPRDGFGFLITILDPGLKELSPLSSDARLALSGAAIALPLFLMLLHLALYTFAPKYRENLFYSIEMAAFTLVVLRDVGDEFLGDRTAELLDRTTAGAPAIAILFGLLTYYEIRSRKLPATWKAFAVAALVLFAGSYTFEVVAEWGWAVLFVAMVAEIARHERTAVVRRGAAGFFVVAFAAFGVTVVLTILINMGVIAPLGGFREIYIFGILALAAGASLYLARELGESRRAEAENERRSAELATARELQLSMLPRELPSIPGLDLAAISRTAAEVGGDYYDIRSLQNGSTLIAMGDATGHGLPAGIVVTAAKALFESMEHEASPSALLARCDRALRSMRLGNHRMALLLARLDADGVTLASAGMPPPLIHRRSSGAIEEANAAGLPLGTTLRGAGWSEFHAPLAAGDTLLFMTDGLPELVDEQERQLGYPATRDIFERAARRETAAAIVDVLLSESASFAGRRSLADDLTLLVARVK